MVCFSYAYVENSITSPSGFVPTSITINSNRHVLGVVLGLGVKKFVCNQIALAAEYQYHDYQKLHLPTFQNFSATYSHNVNAYSQALILGVSYFF